MESIINSKNYSTSIDIPIEELIREDFDPVFWPFLRPECCIYRVPETRKKENEDAYTPHLISIGPFHHFDPKLKPMETQKILYLSYFRSRDGITTEVLRLYREFVDNNYDNIWNCYSDIKHFTPEKFMRMILLDAVFIMELFLREMEGAPKDDDPFYRSVLRLSIRRDLLLIENQIPFFVLEKLYQLLPPAVAKSSSSLLELARNYFRVYDPYPHEHANFINNGNKLKFSSFKPKHFTDLIRWLLIPQYLARDEFYISPVIINATKLKLAGITFEPVSRCLLDVRFRKVPILNHLSCLFCCLRSIKPCLQIPALMVDNSTKSILCNLMAFEQYEYPDDSYISSYIVLMNNLIQTKEDLDLLAESEVIFNALPPDEDLIQMMRSLYNNTALNCFCYGHLLGRLNKHYYSRWNRGLAIIRLVYFKDASRTAATISGLIILAFSIVSLFSALKELNVKILS